MLITFYGINNIGKTTHAKRVVARLKKLGKKAVYLKYPIYQQKPTGPLLNKILRSKRPQSISEEELQLLFVLNRYQFEPTLKRLLKRNVIVVAEDYCGTGIAWGTAKGANMQKLIRMNKFLVQEDAAILLKGPRKLASQESTHLHETREDLIQKTAHVLEKLAVKFRWKHITVADDKDITAARIWGALTRVIKRFIITA